MLYNCTLQYMVRFVTVRYSTVRHRTAQYDTTQRSTLQYSAPVQYSAAHIGRIYLHTGDISASIKASRIAKTALRLAY